MGYPDPSKRDPDPLTKWAIAKIGVARTELASEHPLLATLTRGLHPIVPSTKVRVMRLYPDNRLLINPLAIVRMQMPALSARLAHVALHAAGRAFSRGKGLDPWRWNVAHDMVNDAAVRSENLALALPELAGAMPGKVTAEQIYGLLPDDAAPHPDWCDLCDCPRPGEAGPPPEPPEGVEPTPPPPPQYCPVCLGERFIDVEVDEHGEPVEGPTAPWGQPGGGGEEEGELSSYAPIAPPPPPSAPGAPPTTSIKGSKYGKPGKYKPNVRIPCPHCAHPPPPPPPPPGTRPPQARKLTDAELEVMAQNYAEELEKIAAAWKAAKQAKRGKLTPNMMGPPQGPPMRPEDRIKLGQKVWDRISDTAKQYLVSKGMKGVRGGGGGGEPIWPESDIEPEDDDEDEDEDEEQPEESTTEEQIQSIIERLTAEAERLVRARKAYEAGDRSGPPPLSDAEIEEKLRDRGEKLIAKVNERAARKAAGGKMIRNGPLTLGDIQQAAAQMAAEALARGKKRAEEEEPPPPPPGDPGHGHGPRGPEERPVEPTDGDGDGDDPIQLTPEEIREKEREWLDLIRRGNEEQRRQRKPGSYGSEGGYGQQELLAESMPPPDWEAILQQSMEGFTYGRSTYARPSRRSGALSQIARSSGQPRSRLPAIMPGRKIEPTATKLSVILDTSGSMTDELMAEFLGSTIAAAEDAGVEEIRFIQADTRITDDRVVTPEELLDVKIYGGGGTEFISPLMKLAHEAREAGEKYTVVYLTDLDGRFPSAKTLNRAEAPIGIKSERTVDGRMVPVEVFQVYPSDERGEQPDELDWLDILWFVPQFGAAHEAPIGRVVVMGGKKTKQAGRSR
jgi:hypothetical protein